MKKELDTNSTLANWRTISYRICVCHLHVGVSTLVSLYPLMFREPVDDYRDVDYGPTAVFSFRKQESSETQRERLMRLKI